MRCSVHFGNPPSRGIPLQSCSTVAGPLSRSVPSTHRRDPLTASSESDAAACHEVTGSSRRAYAAGTGLSIAFTRLRLRLRLLCLRLLCLLVDLFNLRMKETDQPICLILG
ncbi:Uncharacterised protein [Actinobaculum suis]|uniref:Uncharacterized protein n=1 Tax=Actinobaculum suis TaxID=1657 RepID=A0A7Z9C975_9ACTO|nr:Uncharacterised protein [Actinobaculum suis]VDG77328.1 Uncharacterised protein [Actinobaculum suis]